MSYEIITYSPDTGTDEHGDYRTQKEARQGLKLYRKEAAQFCEYIRTIANKPDNLDNLQSYLSAHFGEWIAKYANTPQNMAAEMREFAEMII